MAGKKSVATNVNIPPAVDPSPAKRKSPPRGPSGGKRRVVRRIDGKVLLIALVVLVVLGGSIYGLHAFMVNRNAGLLLDQATREEEKGEFGDAAASVSRYLRMRPNDADALERLAALLRRSSNSRQGWTEILASLEHVLRIEPNRHEARRTAISTALKLRRFSDAENHIESLEKDNPELQNDPMVMLDAARTAVGLSGRKKEGVSYATLAVARYARLIDREPKTIVAYAELAELIASRSDDLPLRSTVFPAKQTPEDTVLFEMFPEKRGQKTAEGVAKALLDKMVKEGQPTGQAYLARASYRSQHNDLAGASADLKQAMQAGGADASEVNGVAAAVELAQARTAAAAGQTDAAAMHRSAARDFAEEGLKSSSPDPKLHLLLAEISLEQNAEKDRGQLLARAEKHLRDGLKQVDASREALEPGDFAKAQSLVETEVQLRWSLTDFIIDRLTLETGTPNEGQLLKVATQELDALGESGCRPELMDLLKGRLLLQAKKWSEAITSLEKTRVALVAFPDLRKRVDLLLGETYRIVNNPDRRIETYRRALADDPLWVAGRMQLAKSLADAGRTDEAIRQYQLVSKVPEAALEAARLILVREWQKPVDQRDLSSVDQLLASAEAKESVASSAALVRAQRAMATGDVSAAADMLAQSTDRFPDEISLWQASVALETQRNDIDVDERIAKAEDLIRKAEGRFEDRVEYRLSKVEVARLRGMETLRAELKRQTETAGELRPDQQVELFENLVRYAAAAEDTQQVRHLWKRILSIRPDAIPAWLALANLAIEANDESELKTALQKIRAIEGPTGPNGDFVDAAWQLRQVAEKIEKDKSLRATPNAVDAMVDAPRSLLRHAAEQRPYWASVPRMFGMLETMAGNTDPAFSHYERAFQLGDRSIQTVRGLIDYHNLRKAYEAADAVIQQVDRETPGGISGDLARVAAQVAFNQKRIDAAIDLTRRASVGDSVLQDGLAHAHLLFLKYQSLSEEAKAGAEGKKLLDESRALYRKAVDASPEKPETWFAYIVHFWRVGDKDTALAAIEEAKQKLSAEPASARLMSLAQYYEVVQMQAEAAKHYRLAVESNPSDPMLRRVAADYFFRTGQIAEANTHLEYLLDPKNGAPEFAVTWARRGRALTTAAAGRYDDARRAFGMLRGQSQTKEELAKDLRAQLAVLAGRNTLQDRRDRIQVLEQLQTQDVLSEAENLQLASLYALTDMWPKARAIYLELLKDDSRKAVVLSEYLAAALKNEGTDPEVAAELRPRLEALRSLEPNSIRTTITAARFENHFGRPDVASKILTDHAARMTSESSSEGPTVTAEERVEIRMCADAAEELEIFGQANALFVSVAEHADRPEDALVLATYLGRRGRYAEGLDVCEKYADKALPDATAVTAVNVISSGPVPETQVARAEKLVLTAQAAEPESQRIMTSLAGLLSIQGKYSESEAMYRRVLGDQPENVAVLNNLAWLLALTGGSPEEASRFIDEAIRVSGPVAALLDTRGTVELSRKRIDQGLADIKAAYADSSTPYIGYHLALAYDQAGDRDTAREKLRNALKEGLTVQSLHPAELDTYRKLLERLGMTASRT